MSVSRFQHRKGPGARVVRIIGSLLTASAFVAGCNERAPLDDEHQVVVGVFTGRESVVPGDEITLIWHFQVAPGWHLYWSGRNDSGMPPSVELELPEGWVAGGLQWPVPERHVAEGGILDHVYYDEMLLVQRIGVPPDAAEGEAKILARIDWLACKDMCVPGREALEFHLPVGDAPPGPVSEWARKAASQLPRPDPGDLFRTRWDGGTFLVETSAAGRLEFMPTVDCGELVDLLTDGAGPSLSLRFKPRQGTVGPVRGLIVIHEPGAEPVAYTVDYPVAELNPSSDGG